MKKEQFINPYNFVRFPQEVGRSSEGTGTDSSDAGKGLLTGYIEYELTACSPLFIPNTSTDKAFRYDYEKNCGRDGKLLDPKNEHKLYDFFSYHDLTGLDGKEKYLDKDKAYEPVIPGSEIRGMVRNIYETLTDSCLSSFNAKHVPSKRTVECYEPALIWKSGGQYKLIPAERYTCKGTEFYSRDYYEGQRVQFQPVETEDEEGVKYASIVKNGHVSGEIETGYIQKGMRAPGNKKRWIHIFQGNEEAEKISLEDEDVEYLSKVIVEYQEQPGARNPYKGYQDQLKKFRKKKEGYFPVYYSVIQDGDKQLVYLAPACYTRERSHYNMGKFVEGLTACKSKKELCPACQLFGMVSGNEAVASKIRFTDCEVVEKKSAKEYYDPPVTLEPLGEPKVNNTEFYLKRPTEKADFWTFEYYTQDGKIYIQPAELRGRKFYWHNWSMLDKACLGMENCEEKGELPGNVSQTKLNKTIRPVTSGTVFRGKVYFERITQTQVHQLMWILNCGSARDQEWKKCRIGYKLGAGKPLGLGSIVMKIVRVKLRNIVADDEKKTICYRNEEWKSDGDMSYSDMIFSYNLEEESVNSGGNGEGKKESCEFSKNCRSEFFAICNLSATEQANVSYPYMLDHGRKSKKGYEWYRYNHTYQQQNNEEKTCERKNMKLEQALPEITDSEQTLEAREKP